MYGQAYQSPATTAGGMNDKAATALLALKERFKVRGCECIHRLGKKFYIMDDDHSRTLSYEEWKKGLIESGVHLSEEHLMALFRAFDRDCNGFVTYDEFLVGIRGQLNERRRKMAFQAIDTDRNGALTVDDVIDRYDTSMHPDVIAGTVSPIEVIQNFLANFDGSLGAETPVVSVPEFERYYANLSASIDDDDYFELMIRNVWHISGGEGWCTNTTCRRVLVTHSDGSQTVEEIKNDLGVAKTDLEEMKRRLRAQGVPVVKLALYGDMTDPSERRYIEHANMHSAGNAPRGAQPLARSSTPRPPSWREEQHAARTGSMQPTMHPSAAHGMYGASQNGMQSGPVGGGSGAHGVGQLGPGGVPQQAPRQPDVYRNVQQPANTGQGFNIAQGYGDPPAKQSPGFVKRTNVGGLPIGYGVAAPSTSIEQRAQQPDIQYKQQRDRMRSSNIFGA